MGRAFMCNANVVTSCFHSSSCLTLWGGNLIVMIFWRLLIAALAVSGVTSVLIRKRVPEESEDEDVVAVCSKRVNVNTSDGGGGGGGGGGSASSSSFPGPSAFLGGAIANTTGEPGESGNASIVNVGGELANVGDDLLSALGLGEPQDEYLVLDPITTGYSHMKARPAAHGVVDELSAGARDSGFRRLRRVGVPIGEARARAAKDGVRDEKPADMPGNYYRGVRIQLQIPSWKVGPRDPRRHFNKCGVLHLGYPRLFAKLGLRFFGVGDFCSTRECYLVVLDDMFSHHKQKCVLAEQMTSFVMFCGTRRHVFLFQKNKYTLAGSTRTHMVSGNGG